MTFDLATVQALVRHYQAAQGLDKCTFDVSLVPGLAHDGKPAWATVEPLPNQPNPKRPTLFTVKVRDLASTPVAGFSGDLWTELKVTISHELWHVWVTWLLLDASIENEEALVEAAAQAVVRSGGPDARIMARSIQAIPAAVRARAVKVSARSVRASGGSMDGNAVLEAIEGKDAAAALEILKGWIVEQVAAAQGAAPGAPVAPAAPAAAPDMRDAPMPPKPVAKPGEDAAPDSEEEARKLARKARMTAMNDEDTKLRARQVAATTEAEKATGILRTTTIRARITEARTVDKATISAEAEKLILASPSIDEAEIRLTLARGSATTTTQRARAVDPVTGKPVEVKPAEDADAAAIDGLSPMDLQTIDGLGGPRSNAGRIYAAAAQKTRARLAQGAAS